MKNKGSWAIWGEHCPTCSYVTSEKDCPRCGTPIPAKNRSIIFEDESLRGGFSQIPNVVLRNPLLSANAKVLYCLLLSHAWQRGECFPGQELLAGYMGCTERHIRTLLQELKRRQFIDWKRTGRSSLYLIKKLPGCITAGGRRQKSSKVYGVGEKDIYSDGIIDVKEIAPGRRNRE